ncbi:hypothetical protein FB567DRAFT_430549 [Paraphoma chrysanthemicola]|uniref:ERCC1-like central domain-containing protein n=1 Tax=Paraphoma chrysanthemicola TaxID=798071 RepID=A0A8K0W4Y1_9PLEO|nr:hypothetical protein FB567DRAFT_430549 [Paraphoma chrysanthemicola]
MDNSARAGIPAHRAPVHAAQTAAPTSAHAPQVPVQQPKPQALPSRSGPSSILVSPRQKGNPILNNVKSVAWEYSDIPADYVVGATTCALFLSLKYHRLHPEYIYNRIRDLKGQYSLRILLTMVDIENHEDPLKELSKTSLVNNVTVMLCWSAQEAGRYLELFKTFENAAPTSIRAQQASSYSESVVDFITVPRSINKTDAVGLVSNFGSIRTAVNASPEEIGLIAGWGDKKVQRWCNAVREPFRVQRAARRGLSREDTRATMSRDISMAEGDDTRPLQADTDTIARTRVDQAIPLAVEMEKAALTAPAVADADKRPDHRLAEDIDNVPLADDEEAMREAEAASVAPRSAKRKQVEEDLSEGVMAALSKLRKQLLDNSDLKAARAVSRKLRDNATPALFRSVVACARYEALGAFQKISLHPVLQTCVKEIVFDGSLYSQDLAQSRESYEQDNDNFEDLRAASFWADSPRWKRYQELYAEQEDLQTSGVLLQSIARALEWTTNVSSIIYSPHQHLIPIETSVVRDLVPRDTSIDPSRPLAHPFRQLIGAIFVAQYAGIRELRVESFSEGQSGSPFTFSFFDFPGSMDLPAGEHLFRNLERCILNILIWSRTHDTTLWSNDAVERERLANLNHLLAFANGLRHLSLHINVWYNHSRFPAAVYLRPDQSMYLRLGLQRTWPSLRSASLGGIYADVSEFLDFINRHRFTLRSLTFRECTLHAGAWADVVDEVLYNTGFAEFSLNCVDEILDTKSQTVLHSLEEQKAAIYEGHLEVAKNGERSFVDSNPARISVYHLRNNLSSLSVE